jgi:hypothetical protein
MTQPFPPDMASEYCPALFGWRLFVPLSYVVAEEAKLGRRVDASKGVGDHIGRALCRMAAERLAQPGPIQRAVRARIAKNNRRRFGP